MTDRWIVRTALTGLVGGTAAGALVAVVAALTFAPSVPVQAAGFWGGSLSGVGVNRSGVAADSESTANWGFPAELNVSADPGLSVGLESGLQVRASGGQEGKRENPGHGPGGDEKDWRGGSHPDEDNGQGDEEEDEIGPGDDSQNQPGDDDDEMIEEPGNGNAENDRGQDHKQDRDQNRDREQDRDQNRDQDQNQNQDQNHDRDQERDGERNREQAELRKQLRLKLDLEAGPPPGQKEENQRGQMGIVSLADGEAEVSVKLEMNLAAQLHSSLQFALNHGYEYEWAVQVLQQLNINLEAGADIRLAVEIIKEGVREGADPDEILARLRVAVGTAPPSPPNSGEPAEPGEPVQPPQPAPPQ